MDNSQSFEKQARKALRRVVFWRFFVSFSSLPRRFFLFVAKFFDELENAFFYMEVDAARRYRNITGVDLGVASGQSYRYTGATPEAWDRAIARFEDDSSE